MEGDDVTVTDLVLAAGAGDRAAWNSLVERFTPLVLSVAARHRLGPDDAADVSQTLWLRLVQHLPDLREPAALPGWIATTARHECLRLLSARSKMAYVDPARQSVHTSSVWEEPSTPDFSDNLARGERHQALLLAFAELPDRDRALLQLLLTDPPTPYAVISERLAMPVGGIGPNRARALERLRRSPAMAALLRVDEY